MSRSSLTWAQATRAPLTARLQQALKVDEGLALARLTTLAKLTGPVRWLPPKDPRVAAIQAVFASFERPIPPALAAWWSERARIGVARFPAVLDGQGAELLEVVVGPDGPAGVVELAGDSGRALEQARRLVAEWAQLELSDLPKARVRGASWCPNQPAVRGGSLYLAALMAFASYHTKRPLPVEAAFTGCLGDQGALRAVAEHTRAQKRGVLGPEFVTQALYTVEPWDDATAPVGTNPRAALTDWFGPPELAVEPPCGEAVERVVALLHAAQRPVSRAQIEDALGEPVPVEVIDHPRVIALGGDRLFAIGAAVRGYGEAGQLAAARLPNAPAPPPVAPLAIQPGWTEAAWTPLEGCADPVAQRLGLGARCRSAGWPLRPLGDLILEAADPLSLAFAVQAAAEAALHLLQGAVEAVGAEAKTSRETRPSIGGMGDHLARATRRTERLSRALALGRFALRGAGPAFNQALHHPWALADAHAAGDRFWHLGGPGPGLIQCTGELVAAAERVVRHLAKQKGSKRKPLRWEHLELPGMWRERQALWVTRGAYGPSDRIRKWDLVGGGVEPSLPVPSGPPPDRLPAVLAAWLDRAAAADDPGERAGAVDGAAHVGLRLLAFAAAVAIEGDGRGASKRWLARCTKRNLATLASQGPLKPPTEAVRAAVDRLERLEHHPGPLAATEPLVNHALQALLLAFTPLAGAELVDDGQAGLALARGDQRWPLGGLARRDGDQVSLLAEVRYQGRDRGEGQPWTGGRCRWRKVGPA